MRDRDYTGAIQSNVHLTFTSVLNRFPSTASRGLVLRDLAAHLERVIGIGWSDRSLPACNSHMIN